MDAVRPSGGVGVRQVGRHAAAQELGLGVRQSVLQPPRLVQPVQRVVPRALVKQLTVVDRVVVVIPRVGVGRHHRGAPRGVQQRLIRAGGGVAAGAAGPGAGSRPAAPGPGPGA